MTPSQVNRWHAGISLVWIAITNLAYMFLTRIPFGVFLVVLWGGMWLIGWHFGDIMREVRRQEQRRE